jgi:hypothetical protein
LLRLDLYATASVVSADPIVFNIIWIKWLGIHRDYDRIDEVEHER